MSTVDIIPSVTQGSSAA